MAQVLAFRKQVKPSRKVGLSRRQPTIPLKGGEASLMELPYAEGSFRYVQCSRAKATNIQKWIYTVNKDNAGGRHYATRYNSREGLLMIWRMS